MDKNSDVGSPPPPHKKKEKRKQQNKAGGAISFLANALKNCSDIIYGNLTYHRSSHELIKLKFSQKYRHLPNCWRFLLFNIDAFVSYYR